jgi:hypothetical protein
MRGILIENFLLLSVVLLITIGQILIKLGVNELSIDKESDNRSFFGSFGCNCMGVVAY